MPMQQHRYTLCAGCTSACCRTAAAGSHTLRMRRAARQHFSQSLRCEARLQSSGPGALLASAGCPPSCCGMLRVAHRPPAAAAGRPCACAGGRPKQRTPDQGCASRSQRGHLRSQAGVCRERGLVLGPFAGCTALLRLYAVLLNRQWIRTVVAFPSFSLLHGGMLCLGHVLDELTALVTCASAMQPCDFRKHA